MPTVRLPDGRMYNTDIGQVVSEQQQDQTQDPNYLTGQDIAEFKSITGRDPTNWERDWFQDAQQISGHGSAKGALKWAANRLANVSKQIFARADALGYPMSIQEANNLRDTYMPASGSSSDSEINEALGLSLIKIGSMAEEKLKNPSGGSGGTGAGAGGAGGSSGGVQITDAHRNTVKEIYNELFERNPTSREEGFFATKLAEGEDPFEVEAALRTSGEYQEYRSGLKEKKFKEDEAAARAELDVQLQKSQAEVFNRASSDIISRYQKAGRIGSSGVANALAKAQGEIDRDRQMFLANAGYDAAVRREGYGQQDFVNNSVGAWEKYQYDQEPGRRQQYATQDAQNNLKYVSPFQRLSALMGTQSRQTERGYEMENYNLGKNDYNDAMSTRYRQDKSLLPYQLGGQILAGGVQGLAMF